MVIRDSPTEAWKVMGSINNEDDEVNVHTQGSENESGVITGQKRTRSSSISDGPQTKRARDSETEISQGQPCLAPPLNPIAQKTLSEAGASEVSSLGSGDIFLTDGWRDRWCRCPACFPSLQAHPYLLEEEETYEPPEDPDSGLSLEELGLRALQRLPRDRAIDGIRAFNEMRDELMNHLRPFAQDNKEVTEADIRAFFGAKMAQKET